MNGEEIKNKIAKAEKELKEIVTYLTGCEITEFHSNLTRSEKGYEVIFEVFYGADSCGRPYRRYFTMREDSDIIEPVTGLTENTIPSSDFSYDSYRALKSYRTHEGNENKGKIDMLKDFSEYSANGGKRHLVAWSWYDHPAD